ncbi:MAG: alternate F1F0 ATPase, F1 subunit alpha [Caldilineaceae bacterium]
MMPTHSLDSFLDETFTTLRSALTDYQPMLTKEEFGTVRFVGQGIARVDGLFTAQAGELVICGDELPGMVFNLDEHEVGVVLLGPSDKLSAGCEVVRTGRVVDVPVGATLLGRVVSATGRPLDDLGLLRTVQRCPVEQPAPAIMQRAPVTMPLQTGIKVIDALFPIGRGQRELILGDRQTGKSAIALDTIINQHDKNVLCVYCIVGQRGAAVAKLIADLRAHDAMRYTTVVVAGGEEPPGLQFIAPYAATSIAEHFMTQGHDVLIVYDDLTHHARAYRELSLLLRRPPGREAFPGDIFYIHARLLERATRLRPAYGGGSLTALPIVETEAQDLSAYIPTNLISITDGQIYLTPTLFQKAFLPAVDVGRSVSRVGGKAQLPAYRAVAGALRLAYAQFEELEIFARFSTRLDEKTRHILARGRRVREVLKQAQYRPLPVLEQLAVLLAVTHGVFDHLPLDRMADAEAAVRHAVATQLPELGRRIEAGAALHDEDRTQLLQVARQAFGAITKGASHADS